MSYFSAEWQDLFENHVPWDKILPLYYPEYPTEDGIQNEEEAIAFLKEMTMATAQWSEDTLYPRARVLDEIGAGVIKDGTTIPSEPLQQTYKEAAELGLFGLIADREFGGMQLPGTASLTMYTFINRACLATGTQLSFFSSIGDMIERFCDHETAARLIPKIVAGEISGSMNLTEPGAGSDVGSVKTSAQKQEDGTYLLNGAKIFITNGGGGIGFVLARVKGAQEGLKGISLFMTEQYPNGQTEPNFKVTKIEEKMGMHGSFTCEVLYENTVAHLVGKEGAGLDYMFHLMNESRIGCGLQGVAGLEACLNYARKYAQERVQFGKPIIELPLFKRNFEEWETERDALRCMMISTYSWFDIYSKIDMMKRKEKTLTKDQEELFLEAKKVIRRRTPLVKMYGAETYTLISQRCIQALGGYGFMHEYDVERIHRDSFAPLLYEGTTQIQSLMAMKDLMKYIMKNPTRYFQSFMGGHPLANLFSSDNEAKKSFHSAQYEFKKNLMGLLMRTLRPEVKGMDWSEISKFFNSKNWFTEDNFEKLMIHAETLCYAMSYLECMRVLVTNVGKDDKYLDLFKRYHNLVKPRLEAIYTDWKTTRA